MRIFDTKCYLYIQQTPFKLNKKQEQEQETSSRNVHLSKDLAFYSVKGAGNILLIIKNS